MATGKKKSYTLSEALEYLDNLEVSSSDESDIQPPVNSNDMNRDIN